MQFPREMSGEGFLVLYAVALAAALAAGPLLLRIVDERVGRRDGVRALPDLTVEELALCRGGRARVVHTAVARLVAAGVLRVTRDRRLRRVPGGGATTPVDRAVLDALATGGPRRMRDLTLSVHRHPAVDELRRSARRRGLVHDRTALILPRLVAWVAPAAVLVIGLLRLADSASGSPTGYLAAMTGLCAAVGGAVVASTGFGPRLTPRGRATLAAAQQPAFAHAGRHAPGRTVASMAAAGAVAAGGITAFPDPEVARLLAAPPGGGGGGGGGGGDSGGGGCGGGCGGG